MISYDEDLLYSVFSNIIVNNLRYAKNHVKIDLTTKSKNTTINISNDGKKIEDSTLLHMFERFSIGEGGQSGIGLSLSQEYVTLHRGKITVTSTETATTFSVVLPNIM